MQFLKTINKLRITNEVSWNLTVQNWIVFISLYRSIPIHVEVERTKLVSLHGLDILSPTLWYIHVRGGNNARQKMATYCIEFDRESKWDSNKFKGISSLHDPLFFIA